MNRQGSHHHVEKGKEGVEQQKVDGAHEDPSLQSLRPEHTPVWQRVLDNVCQVGTQAERLSLALPPSNPSTLPSRTRCQTPRGPRESSMYAILKQSRLRWLGHVIRMEDDRIPKDLLYGELAKGSRAAGRSDLRYKDVCKRDLKAMNIDLSTWEETAMKRDT